MEIPKPMGVYASLQYSGGSLLNILLLLVQKVVGDVALQL